MNGLFTYISAVLYFITVLAPSVQARERGDRLHPVITYHDSTYIYACSFQTGHTKEYLFEVFHKYIHIKKYVDKTNIMTSLIEEGGGENVISYRYRYMVGTIQLTFIRKIDTATNRVIFDLRESSSTSRLIPRALQTNGYYEVMDNGNERTVTYFQQTTLDRNLIWLYIQIINHETKIFLKELVAYLEGEHTTY